MVGGCRGAPLFWLVCLTPFSPPQILAKAEFLNPGGSVKDRVALSVLRDAVARGALPASGGGVTEGTSGSTGVSLALLAPLFGARTSIWMPDDAAQEKSDAVSVSGEEEVVFDCFKRTHPTPPTTHRSKPWAAPSPASPPLPSRPRCTLSTWRAQRLRRVGVVGRVTLPHPPPPPPSTPINSTTPPTRPPTPPQGTKSGGRHGGESPPLCLVLARGAL